MADLIVAAVVALVGLAPGAVLWLVDRPTD